MKIVLIASLTQKDELRPYYSRIRKLLKKLDHDVYTGNLFENGEIAKDLAANKKSRDEWYKKSIKNIKDADCVVVEISYPSTANVGHEMTYALDSGKPVIALYKSDRDPLFLRGMANERLVMVSYDDNNLEDVLKDAVEYIAELQDVRFNFFISPKIGAYLDFIARKKRIPRAVYLRRLIEKDMEENEEYNK